MSGATPASLRHRVARTAADVSPPELLTGGPLTVVDRDVIIVEDGYAVNIAKYKTNVPAERLLWAMVFTI